MFTADFAGVISPSFGLIDLWKEQKVRREAFRKIACSVRSGF